MMKVSYEIQVDAVIVGGGFNHTNILDTVKEAKRLKRKNPSSKIFIRTNVFQSAKWTEIGAVKI
jgi:hypothetical protein